MLSLFKKSLFGAALLGLLGACSQPAEEHQHSSLHFGTLIDITLYDVEQKTAETAFAQLDKNFSYWHSAWSPWQAGSLRRANGLIKTGHAFSVGPSIMPLIERSMELAEQTDNLFNPAIGELINLWQFHKHDEPGIAPPATADIEALLAQQPLMSDLQIDGIKMLSHNPAVSLNFGAFAKGYAIDLQIQLLKDMGIDNAIINTGGDLKAIGQHGERPWRIAIRHPRLDDWLAYIDTRGEESIFTSGDYERSYTHNNQRYHHILDPRTGYPAMQTQSVTVLHHDSGLADAAATALFVAGPEDWLRIATRLGIKNAMLVDQQGVVHITPAMQQRVVFNPQIETTIAVTAAL